MNTCEKDTDVTASFNIYIGSLDNEYYSFNFYKRDIMKFCIFVCDIFDDFLFDKF